MLLGNEPLANVKRSLPSLDTLSLAEQVAQMVVVRSSGYLFDHQIQYPDWEPPAAKLQYWLQHLGVGGVILLGGSAGELALRSQQLQNWAKIPLLVAADIEEGVGQRFSGATWFPPPMAISGIARRDPTLAQQYAEQLGAITAAEALAIGINWVLAPVVDVNNNPDNPVINVRAFGETPNVVSELATAFIRGAASYPVLTTAKHFPGHGDTATDSHLDLPVLPHSSTRLAEIELPPFKAAIAAGVDAVMSAHLLIPSWDADYPATLSKRILTHELRHVLGFEGLIVTDALVMGAIANRYGASVAPVLAVEAGADILLMPVDPEAAIQAVCEAVKSGRIPQSRIRASVERIWKAKLKVGSRVFGAAQRVGATCHRSTSGAPAPSFTDRLGGKQKIEVNPPSLEQASRGGAKDLMLELAQPAAFTLVDKILRESQLVHGSVPLRLKDKPPLPLTFNLSPTETSSDSINQQGLRNLIVVDNLLACDFLGQHTPAIALPTRLGYTTVLSDLLTPLCASPPANQPTLLQLFIRGNPFRGSAGVTQVAQYWFNTLLLSGDLQALVLYGSPYALEQFLPALPPQVPCVFSYGQMPDAQAIALETLFSV